MKILNKLAECKQWIIRIVIHRFLYTNGLYKIYGIMGKNYLIGFVVYSPHETVYRKWSFVKTFKYRVCTDDKPQWYKVNSILSEVVYQDPKSEHILHNVSDMLKFSTWVKDRFEHVWNTDKTNMLFFDKETKSSSLLIEDLYLVWYTNYR